MTRFLASLAAVGVLVSCTTSAQVAPSIGMFAVSDTGPVKLAESAVIYGMTDGSIVVNTERFSGPVIQPPLVNELREFLVYIPDLQISKVQVWLLPCNLWKGDDPDFFPFPVVNCVDLAKAMDSDIVPASQAGVYRVRLLGGDKKPVSLSGKTPLFQGSGPNSKLVLGTPGPGGPTQKVVGTRFTILIGTSGELVFPGKAWALYVNVRPPQ